MTAAKAAASGGPPDARRRVLALFAEILEYPGPDLAQAVRECEALVGPAFPDAQAILDRFRGFVEATPPARLEELYTGTFDLDAACHPYVGYHLFGESYKRSLFLLGLKARFGAAGFAARGELPDHLAVLLRFLSATTDADVAAELVAEALLPALGRMVGEAAPPPQAAGADGYRSVLRALRLVLEGTHVPAGPA